VPLSAADTHFVFAPTAGAGASAGFESDQLIVSGNWQPDLELWMQTGGGVRWSAERSALVAHDRVEQTAIAGSAAGYRSMRACVESGRAAVATLFGKSAESIEDAEPGTHLETPDAPPHIIPVASDVPAFFDTGRSFAMRPNARPAPNHRVHALTLADVAASVDLGLIAPADAGGIAEERGAPGGDLQPSSWTPAAPTAPNDVPPRYLAHRFGDAPQQLHLIVDAKRQFPVGTLVYSNQMPRRPEHAVGVVIDIAPVGGIALVSKAAVRLDRFIVEMADGPSPARVRRD
jgi:sarcosine oxidase subunit alpha